MPFLPIVAFISFHVGSTLLERGIKGLAPELLKVLETDEVEKLRQNINIKAIARAALEARTARGIRYK